MKGEVSFDLVIGDEEQNHIEGCFRLDEGDWRVFYFTNRLHGEWWQGAPDVRKDVTWPSGVTGVDVVYPKDKILNKLTVIRILSDILGIEDWSEVRGPDSLQLK